MSTAVTMTVTHPQPALGFKKLGPRASSDLLQYLTQLYRPLLTHRPDDGCSKHFWNIGQLLPDYTALHPRRQPSSYSPWESEISPTLHLPFTHSLPLSSRQITRRLTAELKINVFQPFSKEVPAISTSFGDLSSKLTTHPIFCRRL
jgi:hypothetical protein